MTHETEQEKQSRIILEHLKNAKINLSEKDENVIAEAVREAYITGYDDGLTDGREISENPITG